MFTLGSKCKPGRFYVVAYYRVINGLYLTIFRLWRWYKFGIEMVTWIYFVTKLTDYVA